MPKFPKLVRFFGIIFFTIYFVSIMNPIFVFIDFQINNEMIREELCENKEEPELECNGKCYLMKQLQKTVSEDTSENEEPKEKKSLNKRNTLEEHLESEPSFPSIFATVQNMGAQGNCFQWTAVEFSKEIDTPPPLT